MLKQIALFATLAIGSQAIKNRPSLTREMAKHHDAERIQAIKDKYTLVETHWFDAKVKHFDNHGEDTPTYPMRFLVNKEHFDQA